MSNFVVSARKYRPTTFDEVVGQDHVAKTLKNALQTDHLAHAFLFTGPRGVGKTTCARILAKIINCENPINKVEACNQCTSCTSFNDNASFNILELDAASNNSVDNMRTLIEQVRFQPQHGKYKVFIIDEVHMLTTQAFNAFLKTLEEPPSYAIFILATTEKHKIIPTILSRCQIFDFKRIQISDAVAQLEKICEKEGIKADKEALHTIATKADGAMRDALTIFDKISSSTNDIITYKDVVANLNLLDYEYYFKITDSFLKEDIADVLITLNEIVKLGFDADHFVVGLAEHFRDLLIAKVPATLGILDVSDELKKRYYNQAMIAKASFLLSGLNILNQCDIDLARAKNKRLQVELALSKLTYLNRASDVDIFGNKAESQEKKTEFLNDSTQKSIEIAGETVAEAPKEQSNPQNAEVIPPTALKISEPAIQVEAPIVTKTTASPASVSPLKMTNIDAIRESIKLAEQTKAEARKNISLDGVKEIWSDYTDNNQSKSVQSALKLAILGLEEKVISAKVPTQVSRDMILQETVLLDRLRNELGVSDLVFDIQIDKSLFPDFEESKPVQSMTQREKYIVMLEKNPSLGSFTKKFGLKLDTEV
ncbi:MAG: DNA polymerase III subunit gamma/tau [Saprospiraceae bacterium]|nr:DNA polymerase III subunit gamma/tau [Saprospiraceae bacterium]